MLVLVLVLPPLRKLLQVVALAAVVLQLGLLLCLPLAEVLLLLMRLLFVPFLELKRMLPLLSAEAAFSAAVVGDVTTTACIAEEVDDSSCAVVATALMALADFVACSTFFLRFGALSFDES